MLRIWIWFASLAAALTIVLGGAALFCAPDQNSLPGLLQPEATWTAFTALALWLLALAAFVVPRRKQGRPVLLMAIIVSASLAILLGLVSTWRCTDDEDAFLTPVWQTLTMFVGTSPGVFSESRCTDGVPLAIQLARTLAILAVFATAAAVAVNLMSAQMRRLLTRYRGLHEVVIGFDDAAAPLVRTLQLWRKSDKNVVVLVGEDSGCDTAAVQALGAQVFSVRMDSNEPLLDQDPTGSHIAAMVRALTPFLTTQQRFTTPRVWIMEADPVRALEIKDAIDTLLKQYPPKQTVRVLVRCDDPTLAEGWRAAWVGLEVDSGKAAEVLHDPLSRSEITAIELVGRLFRDGGPTPRSRPWQLVICGDTALAQAVGVEVALRCWESAQLDQAWEEYCAQAGGAAAQTSELGCDPKDLLVGGCPPSSVLILAPDPQTIETQIVSSLSEPVREVWRSVKHRQAVGTWTDLPDLRDMDHVEVLVTDEVPAEHMHIVDRILSQAAPVERVWVRAPHSVATRPVSLAQGIEVYSESILMHGKLPEDAWTAIARISHEMYRRLKFEAGNDKRQPWWHTDPANRTDEALRNDNLAQIRLLLKSVAELGYVWQVGAEKSVDLTDYEWWIVAQNEHARWRANQSAMGQSGNADDCEWAQLNVGSKEWNRNIVKKATSLLGDYGYRVARAYRGVGEVHARHLPSGDGSGGLWLISDSVGRVERVVPNAAFIADFAAMHDDLYHREGQYSAHRTTVGWQVSDAHGSSWMVPADRFDQWYCLADAGSTQDVLD